MLRVISLIFTSILLLAACGGGGGSPGANPNQPTLFTDAPSVVRVDVGVARTFNVFGGVPPYRVRNENPNVAVAGISGGRLTIGGVALGETSIDLVDNQGQSVKVNVGVGSQIQPLFIAAPEDLGLIVGSSSVYSFGGGTAPYTVSSGNPSVVTVSAGVNQLTLSGISAGNTTVQLRDAAGAVRSLSVTVAPPAGGNVGLFTTAPDSVTLAVNAPQTYQIGGGISPYTAVSSVPSDVQVSISGSALTITGLRITERTFGLLIERYTVPVVVRDSLGSSVTIDVSIVGQDSVNLFTSAPDNIVLAAQGAGSSQTFTIGGGSSPYTVTSSNAAVVAVSRPSATSMTLTGLTAGIADVVIRDSAGATITVRVTVEQPGAVLQLLPAEFTISEDFSAAINLNIFGGVAPYRAFTSDLSRAPVEVDGSIFRVLSAARCVNGTVSNILVELTVVDSLGASSTSTMTIQNNNGANGCGALTTTAGANVTLTAGQSSTFAISGGTRPYTVESANPLVVDGSVADGVLTLDGIAAGGPVVVTVRDANNLATTINVTVVAAP